MEYSTSVVRLSHSFYTLEVLSFKKTSILNTDVTVQFVNQSVNPFGYVLCVCVVSACPCGRIMLWNGPHFALMKRC